MISKTSNNHLSEVLAIQEDSRLKLGAKLDKFLEDHKLVVMHYNWRDVSEFNMLRCNFSCKEHIEAHRVKESYIGTDVSLGLALAKCRNIADYYDTVSEKELQKFEKEEWPALVESCKKKLDNLHNMSKLAKLHEKEDAIKQKIRDLESQLC